MRRLTFIAALLVFLGTGCGPAEPPADGDPVFEHLARHGTFVKRRPWVDFDVLYRESTRSPEDKLWQIPAPRHMAFADGWGGPEDWGAWGLGERTRIFFHLPTAGARDLFLDAKAPSDEAAPATQEVTVLLNGTPAGRLTAPQEWREHRLTLPTEALVVGTNELELVYDFHLEGNEVDDRPRALAIKRLGILPRGAPPPSAPGPGFRIFAEQKLLLLEESGAWVAPLRIPANAATLRFEPRLEPAPPNPANPSSTNPSLAAQTRLRLTVLDLDGRESSLAELDAAALDRATGQSLDVPLAGHAGHTRILVIEAELPPGSRLSLHDPRWRRGSPPAATAPAPPSFPGSRPPIVIILLDAARADHFGVYGYQRDTTPHVDQLAENATVFRQTIAECSYTLCSMPSLMSGLSFPQHGVIHPGSRLAPGVRSLAEELAAAGYHTVGLTGNPNNSRLTGADQGFADFREIWEVHPGAITAAAREIIADADAAPLYLFLHYVPPHEPYTPDAEFDVFGDPEYAGPITGERENVIPIFAGDVTPSAADLEELIALYDGNLRMADHAVGEVLTALVEAGLFDQALVVVTSDHGEAMLEHGFVGHNATVYEEMLHVPLIVKWPAAWRPSLAFEDPGRLTSLADVPATILPLLGLDTPDEIHAPPLFAPADATTDRLVFLRSARGKQPHVGVRGPRFKAFDRPDALPELYDLATDPEERDNLAFERPRLHAGLMLFYAEAARTLGGPRADLDPQELSEEDRKMLRALGYL